MPCRNYEDDAPAPSKKEDNKWEAAFCALTNAILKHQGSANLLVLLTKGSQDGKIDIKELYIQHAKADEDRLEKDLSKYSTDELVLLKKLIDNKL